LAILATAWLLVCFEHPGEIFPNLIIFGQTTEQVQCMTISPCDCVPTLACKTNMVSLITFTIEVSKQGTTKY